MDQTVAIPMGVQAADPMLRRRRRPARGPVSLSRLAVYLWRAGRPFAPLALLGIVFGLSLAVIQVVERVTPIPGAALASVSSAGTDDSGALSRDVQVRVDATGRVRAAN